MRMTQQRAWNTASATRKLMPTAQGASLVDTNAAGADDHVGGRTGTSSIQTLVLPSGLLLWGSRLYSLSLPSPQ